MTEKFTFVEKCVKTESPMKTKPSFTSSPHFVRTSRFMFKGLYEPCEHIRVHKRQFQ